MDTRSIDVAKTASIDMMSLNNKVVKMRPVVKRSKAQIVNRLCRHISALKKKKGTEAQKEKNIRKAERLIEEIESIRRLKEDKVSKYSLANTTTFELISKSTLSPNMRALARLADHCLVKEAVNNFRQQHSDWRDLAAFLLVKQTGRKFKTKKQKQKKLAQRVENINASESMTKAYIEERFGKEGLEKAEERFQKKRKKGKGVKVDTQETQLPEIEKKQDICASHDREDAQTDNTISLDDKTDDTVSESENQNEKFTSVRKGTEGNVGEGLITNVVKNKKETISSSGSENTLIVSSTDKEKVAQESKSKLRRSKKEGDSEEDDSADGETEEESDETNEKEDGESVEEDQASGESEDSVDTDDRNETEESDVIDESNEEEIPKKDASTASTKHKIPSEEKSMKSGECVVKKLKIGASSDESSDDDEEEGDDDKISEEDSEDISMEESNSISSKSVSSEQDEGEFESQRPHKKRKTQKEDKSKKNKLVPEFLTKRDQVLKNTPNDPFFVGSDGEEGDDDGDVMRHTEMDFDVNDDYFDDRGTGSSKRTSKSMFYEPGEVNLSGRRFEKKDFSSGFKSRGRGRFEYKGHGRSFEKSRGDFRGRGRGGYHTSSNRGRGREARDDGERKVFKFGSGNSRGEKKGAFSSRGSTQRGRGDKQMSFQRFGSSSSKDSGPVSTSADKLHPSWEASRKRKAEQSGLKAFEGTKIVFDDD